jgi:hypothetical protein
MLTFVLVFLAAAVAAGWFDTRARILVAFAAIVAGVGVLIAFESGSAAALGAAVLMASGSVSLGGMYFSSKVRLAFGAVTALPFAFVAATAWSLSRAPSAPEGAQDLLILAAAAVVALLALSMGRNQRDAPDKSAQRE